jgi:hypothetical protein
MPAAASPSFMARPPFGWPVSGFPVDIIRQHRRADEDRRSAFVVEPSAFLQGNEAHNQTE